MASQHLGVSAIPAAGRNGSEKVLRIFFMRIFFRCCIALPVYRYGLWPVR